MDPRVINTPGLLRWLLVHGVILRTRPAKSAAAYQEIWTERGSPLLVAGEALCEKVQRRFDAAGDDVVVALAMRYGQPSIEGVLTALCRRGIDRVVVMPLYPQYAAATTGSTVQRVMEVAAKLWSIPALCFVPPFYDAAPFIDAAIEVAAPGLERFGADHVLFSFHGVPEDHITLGDPSGSHCLQSDGCCASVGARNRLCYRAHCYATARALAAKLHLTPDGYTVSFQSRLGRKKWLEPSTDDVVRRLAKTHRRLAVFSPAFVADCLETLEELGLRARQDFLDAGGEEMLLVPCVNADDRWADGVVDLVRACGGLGQRSEDSSRA